MVKGLQTEWGPCSHMVSVDHLSWTLVHWKDLIAVGSESGDITIMDTATGIGTTVLSGHNARVGCLVISSGGTFLVSGSFDGTTKLWDIQTGGVIKTYTHMGEVSHVSISQDYTTVASASYNAIQLWDTWTGVCYHVIYAPYGICSLTFSPMNPQLLISTSVGGVQQWNLDGHQIGPIYKGCTIAFSSDGTRFVSWGERKAARVRNSDSGAVVVKLHHHYCQCCFSPDDTLVACAGRDKIHIWDITSSSPHLIKTLTDIPDSNGVPSLVFSSSFLISSFSHNLIQFWDIGASPLSLVITNSKSVQHAPVLFSSFLNSSFHHKLSKLWHAGTSSLGLVKAGSESTASIQSISLEADRGIAVSLDSTGVVRTWDISTGHPMASFHTPMSHHQLGDIQLIDGRLILAWLGGGICIWDVEKGETIQVLAVPWRSRATGPRISKDGSKVFFAGSGSIQAWSIWTGESLGMVELEGTEEQELTLLHDFVHGLRVWDYCEDSQTQKLDLGVIGPAPFPLSHTSKDRFYLSFTEDDRIEDMAAGRVAFHLSGRYVRPSAIWWDHQYLVGGYESGEVLILDFSHLTPPYLVHIFCGYDHPYDAHWIG